MWVSDGYDVGAARVGKVVVTGPAGTGRRRRPKRRSHTGTSGGPILISVSPVSASRVILESVTGRCTVSWVA